MEIISEQPKKPIEPWVVKIFKLLDEKKKEVKTKPELLKYIQSLAPYMNIPEGYELYIYELYALNYRKDGDYSKLDKENYIDPRTLRGKTTPNTKAWKFSVVQLPFKGSNLRGFWEKDGQGNDQYVVTSYDWYPIYIFKDDKWYENTGRYSSSTGRQMSNVSPTSWNRNLNTLLYRLTPKELEKLRRGHTHEQIMKSKFQSLKDLTPKFQKDRAQSLKPWTYELPTRISIKFKINSVDLEGEKPIIVVDIIDVNKVDRGKKVPTPENYTKGEIEGVNKKYVEDKVKAKIRQNLYEYIGTRPYLEDESRFLVDFKFNHLMENQ